MLSLFLSFDLSDLSHFEMLLEVVFILVLFHLFLFLLSLLFLQLFILFISFLLFFVCSLLSKALHFLSHSLLFRSIFFKQIILLKSDVTNCFDFMIKPELWFNSIKLRHRILLDFEFPLSHISFFFIFQVFNVTLFG